MTETRGTILVIDDDQSLQRMMYLALRRAGYEVIQSFDGQEGLSRLTTLQPSLIVTDIMMPMMDGFEMFQQIKERVQDDGIPIVVITALNRKPWFADMEDEGAVILQKPFSVENLVDLINITLDQ
ncbi:MAG: response regulator [Chloroflexaceae bacterium]|nr:response regulator [Chloroflexaceae bacterium]